MRSEGPYPRAAVAIEGSVKYLVSEILIAVFDLRLGFHASTSSTTKMRFRALKYEAIVSLFICSPSFAFTLQR